MKTLQIRAEGTKQYNTNFNEVKNLNVSVASATSGNSGLQAVLSELTPGTNYSITVAAINGAGVGDRSTPAQATTNNGKKK